MKAIVLGLVVAIAGCPRPIPPPPPPIDSGGLPDCPAGTKPPVTEDICQGMSTGDHFPCAACKVDFGCLYRQAAVYCAVTCFDPSCSIGGRGR